MPTLQEYWEFAQLAQASYVDVNSISNANVQASLRDPQDIEYAFSDTQVRALTGPNGYSVVDISANPNDPYGFSATLYQHNRTGDFALAIRGTEPTTLADVEHAIYEIGAWGVAAHQIVSLYNYFQRLITPVGEPVKQLVLEDLGLPPTDGRAYVSMPRLVPGPLPGPIDDYTYLALDSYYADNAIGILADNPDVKLNVTGHSLGGHLAQALSRLFPAWVDAAYAHNTAGFYPFNADPFFKMIDPDVGGFDDGKIFNVFSYNGGEYVTNDLLHTQYGQRIGVLIEDQAPALAGNHSIVLQARSLALHALFEQISPGFDQGGQGEAPYFDKTDSVIRAAAANHPTTYEATLRGLVRLFLNEEVTVSQLEDLETFYAKVYGVGDAVAAMPASHTIETLVGKTANDIVLAATNPNPINVAGVAYRYALNALNPFAVIGADYSAHNQNGELDLYDPTNRTGSLTQAWIEDRTEMLAYVNAARLGDQMSPFGLLIANTGTVVYAADVVEGRVVVVPGNGVPIGARYILFGSDASDTLLGQGLEDHLYSGGGNDTLNGGPGDDYLEGGGGLDVYEFESGDGNDTIFDTDGRGILRYTFSDGLGRAQERVILDASVRLSETKWRSFDGKVTYEMLRDDQGSTALKITIDGDAGSSLTLKNYRNGDFGIWLGELSTPVITGSDFGDRLITTFNAQVPLTFSGNVLIEDDHPIDATLNVLTPGILRLIVEGGGGRDVLTTHVSGNGIPDEFDSGDDILYAGVAADLYSLDSQLPTGQGGDLLSGLAGRDLLVGSAGRDLLFGGNDEDILLGGADDDALFGDDGVSSANPAIGSDWGFLPNPDDPFGGSLFAFGEVYFFVMPGHRGGADFLDGGAGNDFLFAQAGDDILLGGLGNDMLSGGAGNDMLFGGDGDDVLQGDAKPVSGPVLQVGEGYNLSGIFVPFGQPHIITAPAVTATTAQALIGNDYLDGGRGNDKLYGGAGNDTYYFRVGDGADSLSDESGDDTLLFGDGIAAHDLTIAGQAVGGVQNLVIRIGNSGDSITTFSDRFLGGIEHFVFSDGARLDAKQLVQAVGGMTLTGSAQSDSLDGRGAYVLLAGGTGDDVLHGGSASTVYRFNLGDGADLVIDDGGLDTFMFGAGITASDLRWRYNPTDPSARFTLEVGTGGDEIAIVNGERGVIERFQFADGSQLSFDALLSRQGGLPRGVVAAGIIYDGHSLPYVPYVTGSPGPDFIFDFDQGNVTYVAGRGDDYLEIYQGEGYRYVFNVGDGHDVISAESTSLETIVFGAGVAPESVQFAASNQLYRGYDPYGIDPYPMHSASGLWIGYGDRGDWVFVVAGDSTNRIETFEFSDGRTFSYQQMLELTHPEPLVFYSQLNLVTLTEGDDVHVVYSDSAGTQVGAQGDLVAALGGDDLVIGGGGRDIFLGGSGSDLLFGHAGDDDLYGHDTFALLGNDLVDGGAGFDFISGSLGNDLLIGGTGDDIVYSDGGNDVILFNRGDGRDELGTFYSSTAADPATRPDTLSLGGGIRYADLSFVRGSSQLNLETGDGEIIKLLYWFDFDEADRTVSKLQLILEASGDYDPDSLDPLLNQRVQVFDFGELVRRFEDAQALDPGIDRWYLAEALPAAYLGGSNSAAYGGDLAYVYGTTGGYGDLSTERIRTALSDASFGGLQSFSADLQAEIATPTLGPLSFTLGNGVRAIANPSFLSTLRVGAGISASDLTVSRTGVDLLITHSNGRDQLRVQGWYADGNAQWLSVQFSDGTHLSAGQLTEAGLTVHASPAGDTLRGLAAYPNTLLGGAGNDAITGGYLGDVLAGGIGNDLLAGGAGDDTYVYNIGDGVDTILDTATVTAPNSLVFGPAITPDMLSLGLGSLLIRVGTDGGAIRLQSFDPNNVYGSHAIENFRFADGTRLTYADLIARGFDLFGTEGDDTITGTSVTDRIDGLAGNDRLLGGAGSDTYVFGPGSGQDLIREAAASGDMDTLQVLANPGDVRVTREADNVVVSLAATTDRVAIDWYTDPGARIERVVFADGTTWDAATLEARIESAVNRPPAVVNALADRSATEDTAFSFVVPADTFVEPDAGDTLSYSAALADGSPLPAWLTFDPMTRTFSGTPLNANVGTVGIRVTVTDRGSLNASDEFCLTVINTNDPPTVATPIPAQTATEDLAFSFTIPEGAFQDVDGDELTYALPIFLVLPGWLGFDAATGTFFGTPLNEDVGTITVSVEARDGGLSPATASFALTVLNTNDAPQAVAVRPQAIIQEGTPYSETVRDLFWDPDLDDVLTYRAKLGDGSPLPDWLAFDPETASFSGTPGPAEMGFWNIRITATDAGGLSAFTFLELTVTPQPGVVLTGTAGADTLIGRSGNDVIDGLRGPDTMIGMHGDDTYYVDNPSDLVIELPAQGNDSVFSSIDYTLPANVENLTLTGGAKINGTGNALANLLVGNGNNNVLSGGEGDDTLDGGAGSDKMIGGGGNDTYIVDNDGDRIVESANGGIDTVLSRISLTLGADVENLILLGSAALKGKGNAADNALVGNTAANELSGEDGNDLLQGGAGGDKLAGGSGNDILQGEDGDDSLDEGSGNGMLDGGAGRDSLKSGSGNDLLIGGTGNDLLTPGSGADVIAFNLGDGQDTVKAGGGADNTLSLGGGIRYADLSFAKSGNNLVLNVGAGDGLAFVNWYSSSANRSVLNLQVIAEAMAEFDAGSADPLLNRKVQQFDFQALAAAFDAAGQVSGWALTDALLDAHLAGSDGDAIGGDLAYQYGLNGTLSGIGLTAAQDVLNSPQFGVSAQTLRPLDQLQQGQFRLP